MESSACIDFQDLQNLCYQIAKDHGFHDEDPGPDKCFSEKDLVPRWLMLMVTELAEAMEAYRHKDLENFKEELADTVIRILDTSEAMGIDLLAIILDKCEKNKEREFKHGKNC